MKQHWKYMGVEVPIALDPEVDGKECYRFRCEWPGTGATTLFIPVDEYWGRT